MSNTLSGYCCCAVLLGCCLVHAATAQSEFSPCIVETQGLNGETSQPIVKGRGQYESVASDVTLRLTLTDSKTIYREGEIIPLSLAFTSASKGKYTVDSSTYDRSGRLNLETFCVAPDTGRDPLVDYFGSGIWSGFVGGGLSSGFLPLSLEPYVVKEELNEWKVLPPGSYTLRVASDRIYASGLTSSGVGARPLFVVSNCVTFQVVAATAEWQAGQLAQILATIDAKQMKTPLKPPGFEVVNSEARALRFLGSEAATRELVRQLWLTNSWDCQAGLIGSAHRAIAIEELRAAIQDSQHPATARMVQTLAVLEIQSNPKFKLPPYDTSTKEEWRKRQQAKNAAYNELVGKLWEQVSKAK
ncbi:MAG: hypothetical protein ABR921_18390 [Candidatus Sulfotelmatobacter sp.]|jgi:hypothetical protein